jgi:hypothetical protein
VEGEERELALCVRCEGVQRPQKKRGDEASRKMTPCSLAIIRSVCNVKDGDNDLLFSVSASRRREKAFLSPEIQFLVSMCKPLVRI